MWLNYKNFSARKRIIKIKLLRTEEVFLFYWLKNWILVKLNWRGEIMLFRRKKKKYPETAKYKKGDFVNFRYRDELCFG